MGIWGPRFGFDSMLDVNNVSMMIIIIVSFPTSLALTEHI